MGKGRIETNILKIYLISPFSEFPFFLTYIRLKVNAGLFNK